MAVAVAALLFAALVFAVVRIERMGRSGNKHVVVPPASSTRLAAQMSASPPASSSPSSVATPSARPTSPPASSSPSPSSRVVAAAGTAAPRPAIVEDFITLGAKRKAEMAAYSLRHYGSSTIRLDAKVIVVHYTCGSTYANAHATFQSDAPNMGVRPGVVSHFVIDKNGTIYQQIPLQYEGRHTVGLNYVAFGIECVQECRSSDARTVAEILHRRARLRSLATLIHWLMSRYHISISNVIGHGMANDSPYFKDLVGWRNDHTDWQRPQILRLRSLL